MYMNWPERSKKLRTTNLKKNEWGRCGPEKTKILMVVNGPRDKGVVEEDREES